MCQQSGSIHVCFHNLDNSKGSYHELNGLRMTHRVLFDILCTLQVNIRIKNPDMYASFLVLNKS